MVFKWDLKCCIWGTLKLSERSNRGNTVVLHSHPSIEQEKESGTLVDEKIC